MPDRNTKDQSLKKRIAVFIIACFLITAFTFLGGLAYLIGARWLRILLSTVTYLMIGCVALVAMKITGIKLEFDFKNPKQYLIGVGIALILSLFIAFIPALCGCSLVGQHKDFSWFGVVYSFLFYFLVVGPIEELVFRVFVQETLISLFQNGWIGVVLAALFFGLSHLINGSFIQVAFTFGIGLVFGVSKYKIRECKYPGLALGHGLYDFLNEIVRFFVA